MLEVVSGLLPRGGRPLLIAVDGADGAGKTTFADRLAEALADRTVVRASIDDFHHPRAHRHALGRDARTVWERSFDYRALRRELLDPWRTGPGTPYRRRWHDLVTDELVDDPAELVPEAGLLLVDGVFAQRQELAGLWDLVVWLDAPPDVRVARMAARDGTPDDVDHPDQRRYLDAQATYAERCRPRENADVVVDNTDVARPVLLHPAASAPGAAAGPAVRQTDAMSTSGDSRPVRPRVPLRGISSRAWEHPADRGALVALRKLKGFDAVIKAMSGLVNERAVRLLFLGSAIRVDEHQFPGLHRSLTDVGAVLDAESLPEVFVQASPGFNAMTIGMDKPIIVLESGLVDLLDEEELRFVVGHELGHALSGHAVYRTLLLRMLTFGGLLSVLPLGGLGIRMIVAALMEWQRKAELSADRAGLLATQDPSVAFRTMMKLASGGHLDDLDQTSFFAQGAEYDAATDLRDSVLKLLLIERRSHPLPVSRASELRRWVDSGAYTAVLAGTYPRRDEDGAAKVSDAAQEAAASYTDTFRDTQDTLGGLMHDVAGWMGAAKGWLDEQLRRRNGDA